MARSGQLGKAQEAFEALKPKADALLAKHQGQGDGTDGDVFRGRPPNNAGDECAATDAGKCDEWLKRRVQYLLLAALNCF